MITLLMGSNSFAVTREVARLAAAFDGEVEKLEGRAVTLETLPQLTAGATLFADKRLVVLSEISENSEVWSALPEWIERVSSDTELVLVEPAPDKRTKAYKVLQKHATIKEFPLLTERDFTKAEQWAIDEAKQMDLSLEKPAARLLLRRSFVPAEKGGPTIDQWQVFHSLQKLAALGTATTETIEKYIDTQPAESAFALFETAFKGDVAALHQLLADLEPKEDPYRVLGLLTSQAFQLAALAANEAPAAETAKAIGMHPFVASKLGVWAKRFSRQDIKHIVLALTAADEAMKTSKGTPWLLIEQALMKVAQVAKPH